MRLPSEVIPLKERSSMIFLRYGRVDVEDGAFVLIDEKGVRMQIPVGGLACLLLEPGTVVTHAAVALAASCGTLLLWVGESGVSFYSAGLPGGARTDKLIYQAKLVLDDTARLRVVRAMYTQRFGQEPPRNRSIDQLRGIEGARVRAMYQLMAAQYGVPWSKRMYDPKAWNSTDPINMALSVSTHCLYSLCQAAILTAGYSPALGFIHTGKPLSFVYDIADIYKFETVIPVAFSVVSKGGHNVSTRVRLACRDCFQQTKLLKRIIPDIERLLESSGEKVPILADPK